MSSSPGNGALEFSWKRRNGQLDSNRTQINSSGTNYLKNVSILIYNIKEHDEDTYILIVQNHCGVRNSSIYVIVNPDGGKLGCGTGFCQLNSQLVYVQEAFNLCMFWELTHSALCTLFCFEEPSFLGD